MILFPNALIVFIWVASFVTACIGPRLLSRFKAAKTPAWIVSFAVTLALVVGAMAIAVPQSHADIDTWIQLYRYRNHWGVRDFLIQANRPYHYWLEYRWTSYFSQMAGLSEAGVRIVTTLLSFAAMCITLFMYRRTLFRSRSSIYPTLAAATYLISPGGGMMIDSWNDHQPLVPFMIVGTAALLGFRNRPFLAGAVALAAFAGESVLHAAEPWLWGIGTFALVASAIVSGDRRRVAQALALAVAMACVSAATLASTHRSTGNSAQMFTSFIKSDIGWTAVNSWWRTQAVGGPWPILPEIGRLSVTWALAGLATVVITGWLAWRPGPSDRATAALWISWAVAATVFPVVYETDNPERYWTITVLWCLAMPRAVARLSAAARSAAAGRPVVRALCITGLVACAAPTIMAVPGLIRSSRDEHVYISALAKMNRVASPDATLIVARTGSFYLFAGYGFPGDVRMLEIGDRALDAIAETRIKKPGAPVMMLAGAVNRLLSETSPTVKVLWRLDDINPDARMFLVTSP